MTACVSARLTEIKTFAQEKYSRFVDWTSANSIDVKTRFGSTESDCTVRKVAKLALTLFASVILFVPAVLCATFKAIQAKMAGNAQPAAP